MALMASQPAQTQTFNPRLIAGLVAAGIVTFVAFMLLSAYAGDFRSARDGRAHALSVSADGFHGIVRLVELVGGRTQLLRSPRDLESEDLLVVAIELQTGRDAVDKLLEDRGNRATLLILPKWATGPLPGHPGWVATVGPVGNEFAEKSLEDVDVAVDEKGKGGALASGTGLLEGITVRVPAAPQTISGEDVRPLLAGPGEGAMLAQIGDGPLYVLADPDLMNNHGLKDRATALAAVQILGRLNSTDSQSIIFDLTLNGFGKSPSVLKLPFEPPFLALSLALFIAVLLAGLHGAFRFGPEAREERAIAFGKLALVDNSAGLIQLAHREHRTGGAYVDLVRDSAAQASGAPPSLRGEALDAYLDRLSEQDGVSFTSLAESLRQASDRFQLLSAARALFQWKKDYIR
jgi:hypothetical protein